MARAREESRELRRGWTTGACATAAAKAAFQAWLTGVFPDPVRIRLPGGQEPCFPLAEKRLLGDGAAAAVVKDAGDDPDVTHGALVRVRIRPLASGVGIVFKAGEGVGTVTRPGLPVPVGEPAINPTPRALIRGELEALAAARAASADLEVTVSIPGGDKLALKTLNTRLGIEGGLSVLGTTGVVVPFSCASWIASIHRGVDVARAAGIEHVGAATGSTSERTVRTLYHLPEVALIDMGDFVGGFLKYLRRHPIRRVSLAGGVGKLSKLAQGHLDLHSSRSAIDFPAMATLLAEAGAPDPLVTSARTANTVNQIAGMAAEAGVPFGDLVAARALRVATEAVRDRASVEIIAIDRAGGIVGRAG